MRAPMSWIRQYVDVPADQSGRDVADHLIDAGLDAADVDWIGAAREVRARKYGAERPTEYKERARQSRFLQYRGFTGEQIARAFNEQD